MNKFLIIRLCTYVATILIPIISNAYPGESVVRDPSSGDYIITYWNDEMDPPGLETTTYVTATKIVPTIRSRFHSSREGNIAYQYAVGNGAQSKQALVHIILDPIESIVGTQDDSNMGFTAAAKAILAANEKALITPIGWFGSAAFGVSEVSEKGIRLGWRASIEHSTGLKPGALSRDFGFSSTALPGIIEAQLTGDAPVHGWSGEGPPEDSAITQQLHEIEMHDFVPRNVAVPTIAVPVSFDAAVLLDRIRTHVATWPGKQLLDPAFAAQLDRYMVAAADAYRLNNPKAGKEHIETIRELLEHEHKHLDHDEEDHGDGEERKAATRFTIDRLAARVLDFDLRYVLKRMERDEDEHKKR